MSPTSQIQLGVHLHQQSQLRLPSLLSPVIRLQLVLNHLQRLRNHKGWVWLLSHRWRTHRPLPLHPKPLEANPPSDQWWADFWAVSLCCCYLRLLLSCLCAIAAARVLGLPKQP